MNDSVIEGAAYITSIDNTPTKILVVVETSRTLYQQVQASVSYVAGAIIILTFILIFVIRWPLKKYIINPILSLDASMKDIGKSGDITHQVTVQGDDEIVSLAGALNRMLTEIHDTQQQKLESESQYRTLTETSMAGIFVFHQKILYANAAAELQTGYTREELLTMNFWEFVHPDFQEMMRNLVQKKLQGEDISSGAKFKIIRKDGEERWIDSSISLFQYEGERTVLSFKVDITERKHAEDALRENEEKFRALTENTPDIVFSADLNGTITYISPQIARYGFLVNEMVGNSLFDFIFPEDQPLIQENLKKTVEAGHGSSTPFRILDKWQNVHWLEVNATVILDPLRKCTGFQGMFRDITERHLALTAISLANKKLNIMYNITRHDILNKITVLFGLVDMTKMNPSPVEREQFLNEITDTGKTIYRQIALTRDYQEVGVKSPQWNPMKEIISTAFSNFPGTGIRFTSTVKDLEIYADPLIEKVIYNLIDNAIRYGKKLTVISFSTQCSEDGLELICEDDGVGIDNDVKEKIFERGFGNNTGLGLFLIREILMITGITIRKPVNRGKGHDSLFLSPKGHTDLLRNENTSPKHTLE